MKKFILSTILVLSTLLMFSQDVLFARAFQFNIGHRNVLTNEIVWGESPSECNILIKIEEDRVTIFSNELQTYRLVAKIRDEESIISYRMLDSNGINCNFHMGSSGELNKVFIAIEYNDFSWSYLTKIDN